MAASVSNHGPRLVTVATRGIHEKREKSQKDSRQNTSIQTPSSGNSSLFTKLCSETSKPERTPDVSVPRGSRPTILPPQVRRFHLNRTKSTSLEDCIRKKKDHIVSWKNCEFTLFDLFFFIRQNVAWTGMRRDQIANNSLRLSSLPPSAGRRERVSNQEQALQKVPQRSCCSTGLERMIM